MHSDWTDLSPGALILGERGECSFVTAVYDNQSVRAYVDAGDIMFNRGPARTLGRVTLPDDPQATSSLRRSDTH